METLKVSVPRKYKSEVEYICSVVFSEFLGLSFELSDSVENEIIIGLSNSDKTLKVKTVLFSLPEKDWCSLSSFPKVPLEKWNVKNDLPEALVNTSPTILLHRLNTDHSDFSIPLNTNSCPFPFEMHLTYYRHL